VVDVERVKVSRVITREEATGLVGSPVEERPPTVTRATWALDTDSGEPVLGYWPLGDVSDLRRAVRGVRIHENVRAASGRRNRARVFGYTPRRPVQRREACNATGLSQDQPEEHAILNAWAATLLNMIRELDPTIPEHDEATMREVLPEWRMAGTTWTSGVVNQNSQLPYHRDGFNFPTWSAMPVLRRGVAGGHLHLPEYDLTVACRDGWGVFFCGQQLVHGVTPMRRTAPDGYRFSVVYYALRGMKDCHTYAEETAHARRKRTEREKGMAAAGATLDVTIRQARPALQRWLDDNHPVRAHVTALAGSPPRFSISSELDPGISEWAGHPVIWNLDPAEGRGRTDLGPHVTPAAGQLPTQAAVAAGLPVSPDDPAGLPQ
jgi:hypothetical protein